MTPPLWWVDFAQWNKAHPGEWAMGVSDCAASEALADEQALKNAQAKVPAERILKEHAGYLRVYKDAGSKRNTYKAWKLFEVADPPPPPEPGVVATGMARMKNNDRVTAEKEAVMHALRNAVRKSARHDELRDPRLLAKLSEAKIPHEVLEVKEMNGTVWAKVRAVIDEAFEEPVLGETRILVIATGEQHRSVRRSVESKLRESGLTIVDLPNNKPDKWDELGKLARNHSVDLIVLLATETGEKDRFGKLLLHSATIDLKGFQPFSQEMAVTQVIRADGRRLIKPEEATSSAVEKAVEEVCKHLIAKIAEIAPGLSQEMIMLTGVEDRTQVDAIRMELEKKSGVRKVVVQAYRAPDALLQLRVDPDVKDLVGAYLEKLDAASLKVTKQFVNGVEATVEKAQ